MLGAPITRKGFGDLYTFRIQPNKNVSDFSTKINSDHSVYYLKIQQENIISGFLEYPQPVAFGHTDHQTQTFVGSKIFFLEKGKLTIKLPHNFNKLDLNLGSPTNKEYQTLQKLLSPLYVQSNNSDRWDSLVSMDKKQAFLGEYIKKNPNSYVALWEIVNDYTLHDYHLII